jgi:hypothetical protein
MQPLQTQLRGSTRIRDNSCQCIWTQIAQDVILNCRSAGCDSRSVDDTPVALACYRLVHAQKEVAVFGNISCSAPTRRMLVRLERAASRVSLGSPKTVVPFMVV